MAESSLRNRQTGSRQSRKRKHTREEEDDSDIRPTKRINNLVSEEPSPQNARDVIKKNTCQPLKSIAVIDVVSSDEYDNPGSTSSSMPSDFSPRAIEEAISLTTSDDFWENVEGRVDKRLKVDSKQTTCTSPASCNHLQCCVTPPSKHRACPLPRINFADADEVWRLMCRLDEKGALHRDPNMLQPHSGLHIRMRAILLDWLIEVCEVYKMRRETYYLAVDYLDRYLTMSVDCVPKNHLQLIGVTCLFIAAKVEEIYPPKLHEFAYITDSACTQDDILKQELAILATLQWNMSPVTVISWVSLYMQIDVTSNLQVPLVNTRIKTKNEGPSRSRRKPTLDNSSSEIIKAEAFVYPQFSAMQYTQVAQLVDLSSLDVGMAKFPYSVVAAAAISHIFGKKTSEKLSGLEWQEIAICARWMQPFYEVLKEEAPLLFVMEQNEQVDTASGLSHLCTNILTDESHTIQTHTISILLFDAALKKRQQLDSEELQTYLENSPKPSHSKDATEFMLTPPASNQKSFEDIDTKSIAKKV